MVKVIQDIQNFYDDFEHNFNSLQENRLFFYLEVLFAIYILVNLALISDKFLLPALLNISKRYGLSWDITGIVVAIGNLVPELATTVLSFMRHGVKMTEFGVACNLGCAAFGVTMVPAIAILLTCGDEANKNSNNSK